MARAADLADGALRGVRVIDLSQVIAGPYVGRLLADLGADVIKLEPPDGDLGRWIAPRHDRSQSALLNFANVGKRSVGVDLRVPGAAALVLELVRAADAVIENFRPGVADRLGVGWHAVHAANPRAVMLSISGFGRASAWSDRRAFAPIVQAVTGILHDQAATAGLPVAQRPEAHSDVITALHGCVALLAALRVAEASGRGQHVEVAMFDATLASYDKAGNALLDPPDDRVMNPIYDAGRHGSIAVGGSVQHVWRQVAATYPEVRDPTPPGAELATKGRLRHEALERWMADQPSQSELFERLDAAGLACAPVVSLRDALTGPLARERDLLVEVDDRRGGTRPVVRPPARFSGSANRVRGPAPRVGEHNAEVLRELLGCDDARLASLLESGVLVEGTKREV